MTRKDLALAERIGEALADYAERMQLTAPNVDPFLIMSARETAAELLATYLQHVRDNGAARRLIALASGQEG